MCGINGMLLRKSMDDIAHRLTRMNDALFHRGPDASGAELLPFANGGTIALGHRRLSIIDLESRSNQPMLDLQKKAALVFNGEIYNYLQLRESLNYPFKTNSDTEVLLAGLLIQGIDWIKNTNGMFGFAYFDTRTNKLILGRDRLGIKPLYYYADEDMLIFSSEIKGILSSGLVEASFNTEAIDEYLGYRYIREPYTFFRNIYQLPAGHYLEIDETFQIKICEYWSLPQEFNMDNVHEEEKVYSEFKNCVLDAIKRRMVSDVPLGTYLSGGIDSSLISAVCALNSNKSVNTYTIGFPEMNEFPYAQMVAQQYGTIHHEIYQNENDYFEKWEELIGFKDAPLGVPNEIPLAVMSKELKKEITVVLSGEGADELMAGYGRIFRSPFDYRNADSDCNQDFYHYFIQKYEYVPRSIRDSYLQVRSPLRQEFDAKVEAEFRKNCNEENVFRFFHQYHVKGLLQRVDITTMYASVEARVPFLDHELIEFVYSHIPYCLKLKWNDQEAQKRAMNQSAAQYSETLDTPKYLIRKMGLEYLPEETVTRKKMGFPVPLDQWYRKLTTMAHEILRDSAWFNSEKLDELISECRKNQRSGQLLWMFINVELFRKMYFDKEWRY